MSKIARAICRTLTVVAALALVPAAAAAEITFVSGNGTPPGRDALNEFSTDGGTTWQPAYIVAGPYTYSKLPGSQWIAASAGSSSPSAVTRYRRLFDLPRGCQGPTLSVRIHVDNVATVSLNGTQFGSTPAVELAYTFQDPAEGPYVTSGPFTAAGNVLEFGVRNYTGPTALDYEAVLSCAIDTAPPVIVCAAPDSDWHADNVSLACTASDEGSGLANPADASFTLTTSVAAGEENANATTDSRQVCDTNGNCATAGPISGNKIDRLAPTLTLPADAVLDATSPAGAPGSFSVSATDGADPAPTVACNPAPATTLAIGTTTIACTATDHAGNTSTGSFTVRVKGAAEQLVELADRVSVMLRQQSLGAALRASLQATASALIARRPTLACNLLHAFRVAALRAPATLLDTAQKTELIARATRIRDVIGCA